MEPKKDSVNLLNVVPNEIWIHCWNLVTTRDDLKSLSCVCQHFRQICQSLLFREFKISISRIIRGPRLALSEPNTWIIKENSKALLGVISNPALVESVQRLTVSTIYLETSRYGNNHLVKIQSGEPLILFLKATLLSLPYFSKIKSLVLVWTDALSGDILDGILTVAAGLPIEDLTLNMENIPSRTFDEFPALKALTLGRHTFQEPDPQPDGKISIPLSVEFLFAKSVIVAPKVLLGLAENDKHKNLISFELRLGRSSFPLFLQCLPSCPQMKYIVIHGSTKTTCHTPLQLSETSIPKLETFIGPLELALVIAPNRPILCLGIIEEPWGRSTYDRILHDMIQLARSTGPVIKLSFRIDQRGALPTIMKLFPTLSLLNIEFHDDNILVESEPERGVQIKEGRLEVEKPWEDADSLENHPAPKTLSAYEGLLYDVALGHLQLPSTLKILRLDVYLDPSYILNLSNTRRCEFYHFEPFTFWMARRVVYALAKRYPHLQQVHIGSKEGVWLWVKDSEGTWRAEQEREARGLLFI